jgi:hypothetical protein
MQYTLYEQIRWWLPIISAFGLIIKAYTSGKKNLSEFASRLLDNHLHGIETATTSTEVETKKTNALLTGQTGKLDMIQATLSEQHEKQLHVWHGVVKTLAILEDRTKASRTPRKKRNA